MNVRLRFPFARLNVQSNMINSCNPHSSPVCNRSEPKGRFTGQRVKAMRPETYRRVVELLAEPRSHVPYHHICRLLRVSEHTVKAIEKTESAPIAERKQRLLAKALRIADKAADRIESQIDGANITQATVAFGVATEKVQLLSGDMTARIEDVPAQGNIFQVYADLCWAIEARAKAKTEQAPPARLALRNGETGSDSGH
jgi:hypothetical protein